MSIIQTLRDDLNRSPRGRISEISEATGVPVGTLRRLKYGECENPRLETFEPLRKFYAAKANKRPR